MTEQEKILREGLVEIEKNGFHWAREKARETLARADAVGSSEVAFTSSEMQHFGAQCQRLIDWSIKENYQHFVSLRQPTAPVASSQVVGGFVIGESTLEQLKVLLGRGATGEGIGKLEASVYLDVLRNLKPAPVTSSEIVPVQGVVDSHRLIGNVDASVLASEFKKLIPGIDEGLMLGWFANAIMAGYDSGKKDSQPTYTEAQMREAVEILKDIVDENDCRFDHHGGCQEHGYLSLEHGEECPQGRARRFIKENSHV